MALQDLSLGLLPAFLFVAPLARNRQGIGDMGLGGAAGKGGEERQTHPVSIDVGRIGCDFQGHAMVLFVDERLAAFQSVAQEIDDRDFSSLCEELVLMAVCSASRASRTAY